MILSISEVACMLLVSFILFVVVVLCKCMFNFAVTLKDIVIANSNQLCWAVSHRSTPSF